MGAMEGTKQRTMWMMAGCACFFAWMHCLSFSFPGSSALIGRDDASFTWALWNGVSLVFTMAYFALGRWADRLGGRRCFPGIALILMVLATFAQTVLIARGPVVAVVLLSIGPLAFWTMWARAFRVLSDAREQRTAIYQGVLLSIVVYLALSFVPEFPRMVLEFLLPVGAVAGMWKCGAPARDISGEVHCGKTLGEGEAFESDEPREAAVNRPASCAKRARTAASFPASFVFYIIVFSIPFNFLRYSVDSSASYTGQALLVGLGFAVVILTLVVAAERAAAARGFSLAPLCSIAFSVCALLLWEFGVGTVEADLALAYCGYFLFVGAMHARIGQIIASSSTSPTRVFALAMTVNVCGLLTGTFFAFLGTTQVGSIVPFALVVLTYALFAFGFTVFPADMKEMMLAKVGLVQTREPEPANKYIASMVESIRSQCHAVARQFDLSEREEEILCYVMRGWGLQLIADEEHISRNTVKTHVYHIYQKLGVHTREELALIVEAVTAERDARG